MNVFIYVSFLILALSILCIALTYFRTSLPFNPKKKSEGNHNPHPGEDTTPQPQTTPLLPPLKTKERHETLHIGIIDDSPFTQMTFQDTDKASTAKVATTYFDKPQSFLDSLKNSVNELAKYDILVIDYYFDDSEINGEILAKILYKDMGYRGLICLCSDIPTNMVPQGCFHHFIEREKLSSSYVAELYDLKASL